MNILLINQTWFAEEFRAAGHRVISYGSSSKVDIQQPLPLMHIDSVVKSLPGGMKPDVIVFHDNSAPLMIHGLDETSIPTLFYSVDAHHHAYLHKYFGHLFDATLVAHKDYIPEFQALGVNAEWLPLWASEVVPARSEKKYGAVFVGTMDARLNPDRVRFFNELKLKAPVLVTGGGWWDIFPYSEIVINQTVKGDLNFRVFEALVSGAMLLTERAGNGLLELFADGRHLVTYEKGNVDEAAEKIKYYLSNPALCRSIAYAGREEVMAHHLAAHRAEKVLPLLAGLKKRAHVHRSFGALMNFTLVSRQFAKSSKALAVTALALALKAGAQAVLRQEKLNSELACYAVAAALRYDILTNSKGGGEFLETLAEAYPGCQILNCARLRSLLNQGRREEAAALARQISDQDVEQTYRSAETLVMSLLGA